MEPGIDHITVCVCTYKRPRMLERLLAELQKQKTDDRFTYSVVVVDNDRARSAEDAVASCKKESTVRIDYHCEPEQNIALARNRAVANAGGNLIAFIDDDEFPEERWLCNLRSALNQYKADGVLGPVKPHFETPPPEWIIKGKFCERISFDMGTILKNHIHTRTGNVLLKRALFDDDTAPFDPKYGRTGGEDVNFFKRMIEGGRVFVWCDEAGVYESVPPERMDRSYFVKRALMRGVSNSKNLSIISLETLKSLAALVLYSVSLPFLLVISHHLFMRFLIRDCDHIGKLLGILGFEMVRD